MLVNLPGLSEKEGEILYSEHFVEEMAKLSFIGQNSKKLVPFMQK